MVIKSTKKIGTQQRDQMKAREVRGGSEGYTESLNATGVRFSGRPSAAGDRQLVEEARSMSEPDWSKLRYDQLVAAEKMARHRLSGGETAWQGVLDRIRHAMVRAK